MGDKTRDASLREAAGTAYRLLWAMKVDTSKPDGLRLSLARAQLLHTLSNDERKIGIDRARSLLDTHKH